MWGDVFVKQPQGFNLSFKHKLLLVPSVYQVTIFQLFNVLSSLCAVTSRCTKV